MSELKNEKEKIDISINFVIKSSEKSFYYLCNYANGNFKKLLCNNNT
jgi:hypothetical protein